MNGRKLLFYCLPPILALCTLLTVNFKTDLSAFIIAGDNAEEILLASEMQSGSLSRRYLLSLVASDETSSVPSAVLRSFQQRLKQIDGVVGVWSPGQQSGVADAMQNLYAQHASGLYSLDAGQSLAELFSAEGLQERAALLKKLLLSPQAAMIKPIALQDPLLLTLNAFQSSAGQMQQMSQQDKHYRNLILETKFAGLNAVEQGRIQSAIKTVFAQLLEQQALAYSLEMTGVPVFAVATQKLIQGDIIKVSLLSTLALLVLFLLIFRSFSALFQVFSLLAIVILSAILITQLLFGYVHGMTVAIGSTLVGICIDYPIHAIAHARAVQPEQRRSMIARVWPSMLLGGLTTMIGYLALGISGYPGFQQVAVYAISGIIISLLLTRFVFPGLLSHAGKQRLKLPMVTGWSAFCQRFRPWLGILLLMAVALSLWGLKSLQWMQDMQELTPELNYLKENDKRIRERMTSIEPGRFVLVSAETLEEALQKTEQLQPVFQQLQDKGMMSEYFALYPWVLSAYQQQQNRSRLQNYLTAENIQLWQQALKQQGLSVKRLGQLNYAKQGLLTIEQVLHSEVKQLVDSRIIRTDKQSLIIIWLAEHQPQALQTALQKIQGAQYFSQRDMLNTMTRDYTARAKRLLSIGLALIVLLLILRYKSLFKAMQTLLPAVLAAFFILAVWSYSGASISFLHLVGFLLVVAICVDYGIFYQENRGSDSVLTYQAMSASMLTSALAFGSLLMAESTSLRILSVVVAGGVFIGFMLCPLIISVRSIRQEQS